MSRISDREEAGCYDPFGRLIPYDAAWRYNCYLTGVVAKESRKKLVRRFAKDHSQSIRLGVQLGFLLVNIWIAVQFYIWVRFYESGGQSVPVSRPDGIDGWLPIAALMNLKYLVVTGEMPYVHASGMFLLIAFLAISLVARKAFCGWLCPIGTLSEYLWKLGRDTFQRNWKLPRSVDLSLRSLKYILLSLFAYAVLSMTAKDIGAFLQGPYGQVADVKMLNFFRYLSTGAAFTLCLLGVASVFVQNFWCRYLCPYGALMGIAALASPMKIRRTPDACIDCGKCAKACPSALPVDTLIQIRSAECLGCLECVAVCPAEAALRLSVPRSSRPVPAWAVAALIITLFGGVYTYANYMGFWRTTIAQEVLFDLVPRANELSHP